MRRQRAEGLRSRCVCCIHAIGLMLGGILLVTTSGHAGVLTATWTAPLANTDGRPLTDLAVYRAYYSIFDAPCPGSTFAEVVSPSSTPGANETISFQLTGLTAGAFYTVSVTAVDAQGNESACSDTASAVARDDSLVTPTAPIDSSTTPPPPDNSTTTSVVQDGSATAPTQQNVSAPPPTATNTRRHGRQGR
jgi:hypothetical protein